MTKNIKTFAAALLAAVTLLSGCSPETEFPDNIELPDAAYYEPVTALRAQDDFYGYVNLEKLNELEIGYNKSSAGSFNQTDDLVQAQLDALITEIAKSAEDFPDGSAEQLIKVMYEQYMNSENTDEYSERLFGEVFAKIDAVSTVEEYTALMGEFYREYNVSLLLVPYVEMNLLQPSQYAFMLFGISDAFGIAGLKEMYKDLSVSQSVESAAETLLMTLGVPRSEAEKRACDVVNLLLDIASATNFEVYDQQFPIEYFGSRTIDEMDGIFKNAELSDYLTACGVSAFPDKIYINDPAQLEMINSLLCAERLHALKDLAAATFAAGCGELMAGKYSGLRARFFGEAETNREKAALKTIKELLAEELGEVYAKRLGSKTTAAEKMCEDIRAAYYDLIQSSEMFGVETRALLCKKLENMEFLIGAAAPDEPDPNDCSLIGENIVETIINLYRRSASEPLSNIGKPYPRDTFTMLPQTVNACYNTNNTLVIPTAILNEPFFDSGRSEAENLGALGTVIAHEISHAFDSNCIVFDANGNYDPDWLPEADRLAFEKKMRQVEEYYGKFTIMDVYHVDGELTLGENFADLGAMQCVISIAKTPDDKKTVLESYADLWCTLEEDAAAIEALRSDVHSPATVRVNAVVASCGDFYTLYDVKEGDGMYIPPEERVSRW